MGYKAFVQYQFNKWVALEGAYHMSCNFEDPSTGTLPGKLELSFTGFSQGELELL